MSQSQESRGALSSWFTALCFALILVAAIVHGVPHGQS